MANRSTFGRDLPRDLTKLCALSKTPTHYEKRQQVGAVDPITKAPRLDGDGKQKLVYQILPDYDRQLRLLFAEAHAQHRGFKNKRLARELVPTAAEETTAATEAA
jgi:hypothetical protein